MVLIWQITKDLENSPNKLSRYTVCTCTIFTAHMHFLKPAKAKSALHVINTHYDCEYAYRNYSVIHYVLRL